jgi:hypothetical protein
MNYLPYVSWGAYGAGDVAARAAYYASWGLLGEAGIDTESPFDDGLYFIQAMGGGIYYIKKL